MDIDKLFIKRCFDLARLGAGSVSPNPMVGAVIVHNKRIIGEGYHQMYGQAHAEVNAVASVSSEDQHLLTKSTIYVSLEPCSIFGRTPPCTDLILRNEIPRVVISCVDQTEGVNGKGIQRLKAAGVQVDLHVLVEEGQKLSRFRNTFVSKNRPFIILKWAQSADGYIGKPQEEIAISNAISKRLVHRWRAELDAILIGTNTAVTDNPQLNNRRYFGTPPLRIAPDFQQRIPTSHYLLSDGLPTLVIGPDRQLSNPNVHFAPAQQPSDLLPTLLSELKERRITSLLVEGGTQLINHFLQHDLWDEARVLTSPQTLHDGIAAPTISQAATEQFHIQQDQLEIFYRTNPYGRTTKKDQYSSAQKL